MIGLQDEDEDEHAGIAVYTEAGRSAREPRGDLLVPRHQLDSHVLPAADVSVANTLARVILAGD